MYFYRQHTASSHFLPIQTCWQDSAQYGHVNNAVDGYCDTFNQPLSDQVLWPEYRRSSSMVGFIVTNQCSFYKPVKFPDNPLASTSVEKIGRSSVLYRLALFNPSPFISTSLTMVVSVTALRWKDSRAWRALLPCQHIFVDTTSEKANELPEGCKKGLQKITIPPLIITICNLKNDSSFSCCIHVLPPACIFLENISNNVKYMFSQHLHFVFCF
ncbi:hypothetical protein HHUSO_G27656 [Huso huso]|uniref:Thioesterase domain-containing protein n=1 Tax=Huso huso TaxID=61971 RepID=A0ABR0YKN7_HUSHU